VRIFLDSSVLVAAVLGDHEHHHRAFVVLDRVQNSKDEGFIAAHSLAEMYATLTRLPLPFRHSPREALLSLEENVLRCFRVLALSAADYVSTVRDAASKEIRGGTTYDALIFKAALKARVERVYTFNTRHFEAIADPRFFQLLASP
jgi:predicted nucleic acid-binding protein